MTIPLPRPVGVASDHEAVVIETIGPVDPVAVLQSLERQTPADLHVIDVRRLSPGEKPKPARVRYALEPAEPPIPDLPDRVRNLLESKIVPIERVHPKKGKRQRVDLRPYIVDLLLERQAVIMTLIVTGDGTAKPSEVAALLGYDPGAVNHRVRRLEIQWQ
jgi:radical SAM-linked protein